MMASKSCTLGKARKWSWVRIAALLISVVGFGGHVDAFATTPPNNNNQEQPTVTTDPKDPPSEISRRDLFDWPFLAIASAVVTGELVATAVGGLSLSRPAAHEQRVADTIRRSLVEATAASTPSLRVLEVGIGNDCRLIRRGLYNQAIANLGSTTDTKQLEITGIDLQLPKEDTVIDAQLLLDQLQQETGVQSTLNIQQASITSKLPFPDGSFDAVICCLTLCSVDDPAAAVAEMKRLIRPTGGTLGYVEHVAVNPDENYPLLEWQQETLDPLQQLVADNCHLHRYTQETIHDVFATNNDDKAKILQEDRFLVDKMWPVTSQSCGVIQREG
ncbi:Methyltransferase-like protein 7B [Seminavis robusta]|uniref:Methyltransferase-like protein 7B n=1 Tax=Seminavis robusta TaxID=568900 RepID=A0A9N8EWH2_9STRA|nr:Methyltransferase-like protein 7B [Seminavis robusta]|eukprot:Sro2027_g311730.1 Methyltransferase-like protein 7B (331) ;mRNA; r:12942-13934